MKHSTKAFGRRWMIAATLILVLTLLFSGCSHKDDSPESTVQTTGAETVTTAAPVETTAEPTLPAPDFDHTCWDAGFGQAVDDFYCLEFRQDGTLRHYHISTKELGDGSYSFENGTLQLELRSGDKTRSCTYRWDGTAFSSVEPQQMQVGTGYFTVTPNPDAAEYFREPPEETGTPELSKTDISFFGPGENYTLTIQGVPVGTEVEWTSEDEKIASVDASGCVTAVGPGSTRIYARIGEQELACWIRCQFSAPVSEEEPRLNKTDISFFGVGESFVLQVENAPEDEEIVWNTPDEKVASVDENGRVRAVGPGTIQVYATLGETKLYCWVRCQFQAPAPTSSVSDGTWLVRLSKDRLTAGDEGVYVADAELLDRIIISEYELNRLKKGSTLDLSAFGIKARRVSSVNFDDEAGAYTVRTDDGQEFRFTRDEKGRWCLEDDNGEYEIWVSGTAKLVFDANTVLLDQMSAVLNGGSEPVAVEHLPDLFTRLPGFENTLPRVSVTLKNGLVTQATWLYTP